LQNLRWLTGNLGVAFPADVRVQIFEMKCTNQKWYAGQKVALAQENQGDLVYKLLSFRRLMPGYDA
jgi:hypothetical protein